MKQILDENKNVLFEGESSEMNLAFDYLTKPSYILAEERGLIMRDIYKLNSKYWNDATRSAKSFVLNPL